MTKPDADVTRRSNEYSSYFLVATTVLLPQNRNAMKGKKSNKLLAHNKIGVRTARGN